MGTGAEQPGVIRDFATIWWSAGKIVYSRTLERASSARTRIERASDPDRIRRLKETSGPDITIGGAELAARRSPADLVDECHLLLGPIAVGAGMRALPANVRTQPEVLDERRFNRGVVYLHHRASG